jgi:hypothetical protein
MSDWPTLDPVAFHGIAGKVVDALDPHTEADRAALLVSFLAGFGSAIGGGPFIQVGADRHDARIFPVVVGETARARKGSSWSMPRAVLERADPGWAVRQLSGFGSGESVVDAVRDPDESGEGGTEDRRLFVFEAEYSRMLRVAARDGSTLSPIVRDAWDGSRLQARSRQRTSVASSAYVAVLAHVTQEELHRYLLDREVAGGFANRFCFVLARRSKRLPNGGNLDDQVVDVLARRTRAALEGARTLGRLRRSLDAERLWERMYEHLTDEVYGVYGAVVARAEAQCLRFSVLYAALDGSCAIETEHLGAAWELWRYCDASAWRLFGERDLTGNPIADRLLAELRAQAPAGVDGTQQRALFSRHVSGDRLAAARAQLEELHLAETITETTGGRPRTVTFACAESAESAENLDGTGLPTLLALRAQVEVDDVDPGALSHLNEAPA